MAKIFFLTAPDASTRQTTIIDDPVKVEARLRELHPSLSNVRDQSEANSVCQGKETFN